MGLRISKEETFVEVALSGAGKLLVQCGAKTDSVETKITKEVDAIGSAQLWRSGAGLLHESDGMSLEQQRAQVS